MGRYRIVVQVEMTAKTEKVDDLLQSLNEWAKAQAGSDGTSVIVEPIEEGPVKEKEG